MNPHFSSTRRRGAMLVVAERIEAPDAQRTRRLDHRAERFGRIAAAPGVPGEHVPGHGAIGGFKEEAGAAQELSVLARTDQVRAGVRSVPLGVAVAQKPARIVDRAMPRPTDEARDLSVA